jgi:hypothetical protein
MPMGSLDFENSVGEWRFVQHLSVKKGGGLERKALR